MGITLELLMASDDDIASLVRKPKNARAFLKKHWHNVEPAQARSMGIRYIFSEVDYVLRAGRPPNELPLGFLQADGHVIGKVKRMVRLRVGDEIVRYPEYKNEKEFHYGPPHAFFSKQVAEISEAVSAIDDDWVRRAYNPDELIPPHKRDAPDFDLERYVRESIEFCQEDVRQLKAFTTRATNGEMGLIRYIW